MYRLKILQNGLFQIHTAQYAYEGTKEAIFVACEELGMLREELNFAVDQMRVKGHDYADFGIYKTFIKTGSLRRAA